MPALDRRRDSGAIRVCRQRPGRVESGHEQIHQFWSADRTILGRICMARVVVIIGVPTGFLLVIGTWGTILVPFAVAL